jgi:uncharacterized membrane protein
VALLFALAAIAAIVYGLKQNDRISREFGITILFTDVYIKHFEYFWDTIHRAIFFLILAASFWLIGQRAEKIGDVEFFEKNNLSC